MHIPPLLQAPRLEPKERRFVGYEQPYTKIHYELDFSRGADVDIGCGTTVVGDSTEDGLIPRTRFTHPCSMHALSYQWPNGRGNLKAWKAAGEPPGGADQGFFPQVRHNARCQHWRALVHQGQLLPTRADAS